MAKFRKGKVKSLHQFELEDSRRNQTYTVIKEEKVVKTKTVQKKVKGRIISKGEIKIKKLLILHGVKFKQEKTFRGCKNPKTNQLLRFDFYLPDHKLLIEYDGLQHKMRLKGQSSSEFVSQLYRDKIKDKYAQRRGFKLYRISSENYEQLDEIISNLIKNEIKNL